MTNKVHLDHYFLQVHISPSSDFHRCGLCIRASVRLYGRNWALVGPKGEKLQLKADCIAMATGSLSPFRSSPVYVRLNGGRFDTSPPVPFCTHTPIPPCSACTHTCTHLMNAFPCTLKRTFIIISMHASDRLEKSPPQNCCLGNSEEYVSVAMTTDDAHPVLLVDFYLDA